MIKITSPLFGYTVVIDKVFKEQMLELMRREPEAIVQKFLEANKHKWRIES